MTESSHSMSGEVKTEFELEIAHILFVDTVGYSKLLINEQREVLAKLTQIVRATNRFRAAESAGKLIRLPTGDGMALIFSDSPESPLQCAVEIGRALHDHPQLPLRMGIHSGPISRVVDVNDRVNIAGAGINTAQRVMSCGDGGHILLSKHAAEDLAEYPHWQPFLKDLGECEVKHGAKLGLVNFFNGEAGNPEMPSLLKRMLEQKAAEEAARRLVFRRKFSAVAALCLILLAVGLALYAVSRWKNAALHTASFLKVPDKSIAVLPFENLTDDKQNIYLADGIMDEILTNLAKVADLKVISRTSVMQYRAGQPRSLRDIAAGLGVAHVLEGTVQRFGDHLRVNAQLIDARTDAHLWAERYDRQIADVFAIESELAESIAAQLRLKLSAEEKAAIERPPTSDMDAYDLYVRAKHVLTTAAFNMREKEKLSEAEDLLNQAIARDPTFFLAYYHLARTHDRIYILGIDHTPARLQLADAAIKTALNLRPNAGEGHLALAAHLYTERDYDRARQELSIAGRALPNEPLVFELTGYIDRRQGRWDECLANLGRTLELDPHNSFILQQIALAFEHLRRFPEMAASLDQALLLVPKDVGTRAYRALTDLEWRADTAPLHSTLQTIIADDPNAAGGLAQTRLYLALCERDHTAALQALAALTSDGCRNEGVPLPRTWCEGVAARARGDSAAARAAFTAAREEIAKTVREQPNYAQALCVLGLADSGLGFKEEAIRQGERAVQLLPVNQDAINGALLVEYLAVIYAWTGENTRALEQLEVVTKIPCDVSYGQLRLHPYWDPLRGDPRFDKIVAALAPK